MVPHRYPFRFLDRAVDGSVRVQITGGGRYQQPPDGFGLWLVLEILAQACMLLPRGLNEQEATEKLAFLVGVDRAELNGKLEPGDRLSVQTRVVARYGSLVKVEARLLQGRDQRAEAELSFATRV